jgi:hypothetical protein
VLRRRHRRNGKRHGPLDLRLLSITIEVPLATAYHFAHRPENFPLWAAGLSGTLTRTDRGWIAQTPAGEATVRFAEPNAYGVLDHHLRIGDAPEIHVPLRMIANGDGTEIVFVLFRQPAMSDADFDRDAALPSRSRPIETAAGGRALRRPDGRENGAAGED